MSKKEFKFVGVVVIIHFKNGTLVEMELNLVDDCDPIDEITFSKECTCIRNLFKKGNVDILLENFEGVLMHFPSVDDINAVAFEGVRAK